MSCLIAFNMLARFSYLLCSQGAVAESTSLINRKVDMTLKVSRSNPSISDTCLLEIIVKE